MWCIDKYFFKIYIFISLSRSDGECSASAQYNAETITSHGNQRQTLTGAIPQCFSDPGLSFDLSHFHGNNERPHPVFSHLEHTTGVDNSGAGCVSIPFHCGTEPRRPQQECTSCASRRRDGECVERQERDLHTQRYCDERHDTQLVSRLQSLSVAQQHTQNECTPQLGGDYNHHGDPVSDAARVADSNGAQWVWSRGCHGNCRGEALGVGYVQDDVTVDDLTGYFDQMLHLPKPMSDMAKLMYT